MSYQVPTGLSNPNETRNGPDDDDAPLTQSTSSKSTERTASRNAVPPPSTEIEDGYGVTEDESHGNNGEGDDDDIVDISSDLSDKEEEEDTIMKSVDDSTPPKTVSTRKILDVIGISGLDKGGIGVRKLKNCNLHGLEEKKR